MLTALVLVCSLGATPNLSACNADTAVHVIRAPVETMSPVSCLMHGQAYLAETSIGERLTDDQRVKVVCTRQVSTAMLR